MVTVTLPLSALPQELSGTHPNLPRIDLPRYHRSEVTTGIVHFGVGGFHRAHQAMVLDRLMNDGKALDWGICGVGILPADSRMRDVMRRQDGRYTLVYRYPDGTQRARVIGSITEYLFAPDDPEAVIEKLADPATRIVSLTVTEGGYNVDPATGQFDHTNPQVIVDLQPGAAPATVFGLVTAGLARRRQRGIPPFTVQSCDNIRGNGALAARMFAAFASLQDPDLGEWMRENVAFPNSMVDRITPVTTDEDRADIQARFGVVDEWPVVCEPFFQWVLEDDFPQGRPPYQDADVQLVRDVEPYELMKLRLLNASHQAMAYFGYLSGFRYAHEASTDPAIGTLVRRYMDEEATPTLRPVDGVGLDAYKSTLMERFGNPSVGDTLARLCAESSDRIPTWLVPVIQENLAAGRSVRLSAAIVASWARYAEGVDERGADIQISDRLASRLVPLARSQDTDPLAFVKNRSLFADLADHPEFTQPYLAALASLKSKGAHATVRDLVRAGGIR